MSRESIDRNKRIRIAAILLVGALSLLAVLLKAGIIAPVSAAASPYQ
jgi:hypothetical protein